MNPWNMYMQVLSKIYEKYQLYLICLRHLLGLSLYFDMKFNSVWESCKMKSFTSAKIDVIKMYKNNFVTLYMQTKIYYIFCFLNNFIVIKNFDMKLTYLFTIII